MQAVIIHPNVEWIWDLVAVLIYAHVLQAIIGIVGGAPQINVVIKRDNFVELYEKIKIF